LCGRGFRGNGHAMHAEALSHLLPATPPVNVRRRWGNLYTCSYEHPTAVCRCVLVRAEWQLENFFNLKKFCVLSQLVQPKTKDDTN